MRFASAVFCLAVFLSLTPLASADQGGVVEGIGTPPVITDPPRTELIEAWNDDQPWSGSFLYAASCFGLRYVPGQTYILESIEFYASGGGQVTVEVRQDDGNPWPTGPVLGSATYVESSEPSWQGGTLNPPVALTAGTAVFINYQPVINSRCSFADSGVIIPHSWSYDCVTWNGPGDYFPWMARFYGTLGGNPTATSSWGRIKSLYF